MECELAISDEDGMVEEMEEEEMHAARCLCVALRGCDGDVCLVRE